MFILILMLAFHFYTGHAKPPDLCDILKLDNCSGVTKQSRRSSALSLPSSATSAQINPANVSFDRGLGLEVIHQEQNPLNFSLNAGSGKLGGALITSSLENAFFANRSYEPDDRLLNRHLNRKQFKTNKHTLAMGAKLSRNRTYALDTGIILKRHSLIKRINPGLGVSGRIKHLHFGGAIYQDDYHLNFLDSGTSERGKFRVTTFSMGTRISSVSLDAGVIESHYQNREMNTRIYIYSTSYIFKNYLFNLAHRKEISQTPNFAASTLENRPLKFATFTGVQASFGKYLIMGINYNYFLLNEFSLMSTFYF
jgi:hypothetical protein